VVAVGNSIERIAELREDRNSGALGDEVIKMAQALIFCTLPYRPTDKRQVVRTARLSDGSTLHVTFTAGLNGVDMAYGNDRDLMAWLFDKAINSETSFVTIKNATEYLREIGKQRNGDRVKELAARLRRLSGLVIGIERRGETTTRTMMLPMIAASNLPHNLTMQLESEESGQKALPGLGNLFGIQLEERLFQDIKRHHVAIPRRLWLQLQGQKGGPTTFFVYRCYCVSLSELFGVVFSAVFGVMFSHAGAERSIRGHSGPCDVAIPADPAVLGGATLPFLGPIRVPQYAK
jgi:hypothetical protein